jgi:RNA polymerase sigma-70 factor, ECF subfamily
MKDKTEAELLRRCRRGESAAWDELFQTHYAAAGRFVFQLGYDFTPEDVEEICQEAFLSVVRNLRNFKMNSQFQTWLFRIAANKARDYRQRQQAVKRGGGRECVPLDPVGSEYELPVDPPSPAPGPDLGLVTAENIAAVGRALDSLDEESRELIELRYFADLSYDEIGQSLGVNSKTVSSRLSRALDKLERTLKRILGAENARMVVGVGA